MTKKEKILFGIVLASAIYFPIGIYLFDHSPVEQFTRCWFMICGGAIALYADRT